MSRRITVEQFEARAAKFNRRAERLEMQEFLYRHGFSRALRLRSTDAQLRSYAKKMSMQATSLRRKCIAAGGAA